MMYKDLNKTIGKIVPVRHIREDRKVLLQPLIGFLQEKQDKRQDVNLNFICTHNSRRSHLSQVWAQVASRYYDIPNVYCYSGGMEATALFPKIAETLITQGFSVLKITATENPVYAIKYSENALPVIGFSKTYDNPFNPVSEFAAILTCSQADQDCPVVTGAEARIPIPFEDPKIADGTPKQTQVYSERSLQIASELFYVFSMIKK